jgi:hypothetical protein
MLFAVYFDNEKDGLSCMTAVFMMKADAQTFIDNQHFLSNLKIKEIGITGWKHWQKIGDKLWEK